MDAALLKHFETLYDPRVDRTKRYPLIEIIFLIISATVSGCEGQEKTSEKSNEITAGDWKKLTSVVMIESVRESTNINTRDTRLYISSCQPSAELLLNASRKHWGVENSVHWTLDVTFREDESRIRKEASPENYAIFRHIALNIIRKDTSVDASVKRKRHMAALNDNFRTTLIQGII